MKVFVLVIFMLLPNGEERVNIMQVPECPSASALETSIATLKYQGVIKGARAACQPLVLDRTA